MSEPKKSNKKLIIAIVCIIAAICIMLGISKASQKTIAGAKAITIEVVDDTGAKKDYYENTDAEYLNEAMDELQASSDFSYEGEKSDYGIMITTINGIKADYDTDGAYWAIYVNGEYGQYGADQQPVTDGDVYQFAYTKG